MFVVATFNEIKNPTLSQRLKYIVKKEQLDISKQQHYYLVQVNYLGKKRLQRIIPKLFTLSNTIIADKTITTQDIIKYSLYTPKEFMNQVAINTICYAMLRSRAPINKRNITFVDKEGNYKNLARILVEHFFYVNIVTDNEEAYEEFKNKMMNELGAVVLLNSNDEELKNICISTETDVRGSFKVMQHTFVCEDTIIKGIDIPHDVNRLYFAAAMQETENSEQYQNIVAETLVSPETQRCCTIHDVVRVIDKNIN